MKGLINLKNKDHKCFMWCHVRFIKTLASNLEDNDFKYLLSEFPVDKLEILKRKLSL